MSLFNRKQNSLEKRLKRIEKELASVNSNLKTLKKKVPADAGEYSYSSPGDDPGERSRGPGKTGPEKYRERVAGKDPSVNHDERLADFLSGSFHAGGPLRHERRVIRNRAILMIVIVVFVILCFLYNIFS